MGMIINPYVFGAAFDADAQAFITAAGITDNTQKSAINTLVSDLKGYGIWTKMKAIYPFVGGTASTHSYNLKNTSQYQLSFSGGWTHSSTGALPNGTNAYADTLFIPNGNVSLNSVHLSYYSRTISSGFQSEFGVWTSSPDTGLFLSYNFAGGNYKGLNASSTNVGSAFQPSNGFLLASRINGTTEKYYWKGSLIDTLTKSSNTLNVQSLFIGAHRINGNPANYSQKQTAFATIGDGLTDTESANFYTAVQAFQTTLSRQV